jgi:cell wall-associated NlpC family hydrolase
MGRVSMSAAKRPLVAMVCIVGAVLSGVAPAPGISGLAPANAAVAEVAPQDHDPLGQALMTAAKAAGVLDAIEGSLVYLGAKYESATTAEKVAEQSSQSQAATFEEYASGKVPLPPASAGSNGTEVQPPPGSHGEPLVARIPAKPNSYGDPPATYVSGVALSPPGAPERVAGTINAANTIVGRPYVWGGGHGSWYDRGYDCSGAVSFALAGGGFLSEPLASGQLASWGAPGPGRWITIYASPSHVYAVIAGLRWDTVGDARGSGPRWHVAGTPPAGFVARHPPGY